MNSQLSRPIWWQAAEIAQRGCIVIGANRGFAAKFGQHRGANQAPNVHFWKGTPHEESKVEKQMALGTTRT